MASLKIAHTPPPRHRGAFRFPTARTAPTAPPSVDLPLGAHGRAKSESLVPSAVQTRTLLCLGDSDTNLVERVAASLEIGTVPCNLMPLRPKGGLSYRRKVQSRSSRQRYLLTASAVNLRAAREVLFDPELKDVGESRAPGAPGADSDEMALRCRQQRALASLYRKRNSVSSSPVSLTRGLGLRKNATLRKRFQRVVRDHETRLAAADALVLVLDDRDAGAVCRINRYITLMRGAIARIKRILVVCLADRVGRDAQEWGFVLDNLQLSSPGSLIVVRVLEHGAAPRLSLAKMCVDVLERPPGTVAARVSLGKGGESAVKPALSSRG